MSDATRIEFNRFGSNLPTAYWGCCAADIIQCFTGHPDDKASIEMVDGDGGQPCLFNKDGKYQKAFAGPTNRDIFMQRLRVGTFGIHDMPNHAFFAIITDWQAKTFNGKAWLKILKETGFEFVRTVSNSVYAGKYLGQYDVMSKGEDIQYIFMLVRNIGSGGVGDPYSPPKEWTGIDGGSPSWLDYTSSNDFKELAMRQHASQTEIWNKIGPAKFLTEAEVEAAGAPVIYAAKRDYTPQEEKSARNCRASTKPTMNNPFEVKTAQ